jgi:predicted flap endonuclease-1-like 5' DNA nuclease
MNTEKFFEGPGASTATTYVWEIALILLGAFILGYLLRYLLNGNYKTRIAELEGEITELKLATTVPVPEPLDTTPFEDKIKQQRRDIDHLNQRLSESLAKKIKVENELLSLKTTKSAVAASVPAPTVSPIAATVPVAKVAESVGGKKDNLKKIEGIGPKIEELLNNDGVYTYKQLIMASVDRIKKVLTAAGPNYAVHDPSTWGEQAGLADAGKWDELSALQDVLKGGKRK